MTRILGALAAASLVAACATASTRVHPPLEAEGELYVYLQPLGAEADRLALTLEAVDVRRASAPPVSLTLPRAGVLSAAGGQRLVAWGRLPPGAYEGVGLLVKGATLSRPEGAANLLVQGGPTLVDAPLQITRGAATVVWLTFDAARSLHGGVELSPSFTAMAPPQPVPEVRAWVTSPEAGTVALVDAQRKGVVGVFAVGGEPWGVALSEQRQQVYVSRAAADDVLVLDVPSGVELGRIRLRPGDRPGDVALTPDGRLLVVVDSGADALSLVDPVAQVELERVAVGREPSALTLDRAGRTAYVCNRLSGTVSVVDLPTRSVRATVTTDPDPVAAQLDRAETRLHVAHGFSSFLTTYTLPDLRPSARTMVGPDASTLRVDPRTGLLYVGRGAGGLDVFEPGVLVRLSSAPAAAGASYAVIDDARNLLWVLGRAGEAVTLVDPVTRRQVGLIELPGPPERVALPGERR